MSSRIIYTVSQLTAEIKSFLEGRYQHLWVEGEISNLRLPSSGHLYFTLKDPSAQLRSVMFRMQNRLLKFAPEDGLQVVAYGHLTVYEPRGDYQIIIDYLEPKGWGALQLAFEQLKEKLAREGLFDAAHKKPLPALPQRIGIVTSPTGAAIRDILQIIERRFANVHIFLCPVRVQGEGAAQEIALAIRQLNEWPGLDVIIVARGGGSLEDLWAFNEEVVARAIFDSRVPVISAVGHEIDFTIADFVADLRAPTPSAAAELVVRNKMDFVQTLEGLTHRLGQAGRIGLRSRWDRLSSLMPRLTDPRRKLADQRLHLDDLFGRLGASMEQRRRQRIDRLGVRTESLFRLNPGRRIAEHRRRFIDLCRGLAVAERTQVRNFRQNLEGIGGRLHTLSPMAVLGRGYSITRVLPAGEVVRRVSQLRPDDRVRVRVQQGEFIARVEKIKGPKEPG
jgi:exodeoxyribonuclease VII large subunit